MQWPPVGLTAAFSRSVGYERGRSAGLAVDDAAEAYPAGAVEAPPLHLLDRRVIGRARVKGNARSVFLSADKVASLAVSTRAPTTISVKDGAMPLMCLLLSDPHTP